MKKLLYIIVFVIMISYAGVVAADGNLIPNPGFEEGSKQNVYFWTKHKWDQNAGVTEFEWDSSHKHSGMKSVKITNNKPNDARYKQVVSAEPNSYYKISCWVRTEDVGSKKGANISVENIIHTSIDVKGTSSGWQYLELYGRTGPQQKSFTVTVGLGGYGSINTGRAWFDDVTVQKTDTVPVDKNAVNFYRTENSSSDSGSSNTNSIGIIVLAILALLSIAAVVMIFRGNKTAPADNAGKTGKPSGNSISSSESKFTIDKRDIIIMACMTLVYTIIALVNLGSFKVPETGWKPTKPGESFVIDLGEKRDISRIYYYQGHGDGWNIDGSYRIEYADESETFKSLASFKKNDFYKWNYINVTMKTDKLKIITDKPGGTLKEIGIFEKGHKTALRNIKIISKNVDPNDEGKVEYLFDESKIIEYRPSFKTSTYFDEIYHVRTAFEHMHRLEPYENTHPPLGKILISIGIYLFGMNAFGWRVAGALFGAAMIPAMYLFGKKIFGSWFYGFCTAYLIMFDFMHFSQTRIATIDVYATFFIILMYYYMYDYFMNKSYELGYRQSLRPLFFSGLYFGAGVACKWISIYAGAGLAVLFFAAKYLEYMEYSRCTKDRKYRKTKWVKNFIPYYVTRTMLYCVLFFVIIPAIIYVLSYIPFMLVHGPGHGLKEVWSLQSHMFNYHSKLVASHSFSSPWYQWPVMYRPTWFYSGRDMPQGITSTIVSMGNPAIWWIGIVTFISSIYIAFKKRDKKIVVVFVAMAFQYLPWILVSRITWIYHFFSSVPFVILTIVYVLKYLMEEYSAKYSVYIYLGIVLLLFVLFYPAISGMLVPVDYINRLKWFDSWVF